MALKQNGEAPFPLAGEGCFVCFPALAIAALEEIYGIGDYFEKIELNLNAGSAKTMINCLKVGLFRRDENSKRVKVELDFNELDFAVSDSALPILDGLCLSSTDMTYLELITETVRQNEIAKAANKPEGGCR